MNVTKAWYTSRTIWASLVTVVLAVGGMVGLPVAGIEAGPLADAILQSLSAVAGVVAILGRMNARARIG